MLNILKSWSIKAKISDKFYNRLVDEEIFNMLVLLDTKNKNNPNMEDSIIFVNHALTSAFDCVLEGRFNIHPHNVLGKILNVLTEV